MNPLPQQLANGKWRVFDVETHTPWSLCESLCPKGHDSKDDAMEHWVCEEVKHYNVEPMTENVCDVCGGAAHYVVTHEILPMACVCTECYLPERLADLIASGRLEGRHVS